MNIIENLNWRYATKKFDPTFKMDREIDLIKSIIQLSPSSYGLQAYKVLIITNPEVREKLREASWNQPQITDASVLLVFVKNNVLDETEVESYIENVANTRGISKESLTQYEGMIKYAVSSQNDDQKSVWVQKQIYLALGNLLTSLSVLGFDACPMEGFDRSKYDEILNLKDTSSVVVCAVGKRDSSDETQNYKKVRKSSDDLFVEN